MKKRNVAKKFYVVAGSVASVAAMALPAMATPILDFTGMTAAVTGELTPAVTAALPIAGTILAVGLGVKLYKRFVK